MLDIHSSYSGTVSVYHNVYYKLLACNITTSTMLRSVEPNEVAEV